MGVQLATHLGGDCTNQVALEGVELIKPEGVPTLQVAVRNTGAHFVRPDFWIELYRDGADPPERLNGQTYRLYPGTAVSQRIDVSALPSGSYHALLVIDAGDEDIFGAQVSLDL